jgi:hypothetical protein
MRTLSEKLLEKPTSGYTPTHWPILASRTSSLSKTVYAAVDFFGTRA